MSLLMPATKMINEIESDTGAVVAPILMRRLVLPHVVPTPEALLLLLPMPEVESQINLEAGAVPVRGRCR